jgi:hypothetical protein
MTINDDEDTKNIKVCKELCKPYKGSHRVVFIERFYSSIELVKELLEKMSMYVTGTILANQVPAHLKISKRSREFREMDRGYFKKHSYQYTKRWKCIKYGFDLLER